MSVPSKLAEDRRTSPRAKTQVKEKNTSKECDAYLCNFCNIAAVSMHMCPSAFTIQLFCKACLHRHQSFGPCTLSKASTPRQGDLFSHQINTTYHLILRDKQGRIIKREKCQEHGIVTPFFCRCCNKHRCIKCVEDNCFQYFGGRSWSNFIDRDKQSLLEHYEKASATFNIIEKRNHMLRAEFDQLQTTTLLRRERIRQEFVSFHDLLIKKEHDMLKQLDQDERERMDTLNNLQANLTTLELDDANLATMVTDLVQTCCDFSSSYEISSINYSKFVVDCESLKNECNKVEQLVTNFQKTWNRDLPHKLKPLIDRPFSMFAEKKHVSEKLDAAIDSESLVKFKQATLTLLDDDIHTGTEFFIPTKKFYINKYIHAPVIPTSTKLRYCLKLTTGRRVLYQTETEDLSAVYLNTHASYAFKQGDCCVLQLTPMLIYQMSAASQVTHEGTPTHMLIVVDHDI